MKKFLSVLAMTGIFSLSAQAGIIAITTDQTGFVTDTGATSAGSIPQTPSGSGFSVGVLSFSNESPSSLNATRNWTNFISEPYDLAVNGQEQFNIDSSVDLIAIGFMVVEPDVNKGPNDVVDSCNATCFDSTFEFEIFKGATSLGSVQVGGFTATGLFFGILSDTPFDRLQIREPIGGIDNEFFGNFLIATGVPAPATLGLLGFGLAGLGFAGRRRR